MLSRLMSSIRSFLAARLRCTPPPVAQLVIPESLRESWPGILAGLDAEVEQKDFPGLSAAGSPPGFLRKEVYIQRAGHSVCVMTWSRQHESCHLLIIWLKRSEDLELGKEVQAILVQAGCTVHKAPNGFECSFEEYEKRARGPERGR